MPRTTTMIIEFGDNHLKVGYAGDFLPMFVESVNYKQTSKSSLIEKYCTQLDVDSAIIVEDYDESVSTRKTILSDLLGSRVLGSLMFLKNTICDSFGHGKTSCTVLRFTDTYASATTVLTGQIQETHLKELDWSIELSNILKTHDKLSIYSPTEVLDSDEIIQMIESEFNIKVFDIISDVCLKMINNIYDMRNKYRINKKNTSNGCIILSGSLFRFKSFYNYLKKGLLNKISHDYSDFVLKHNLLDCTFAGASLFGANDKSKLIFITQNDYLSLGNDILKTKVLHP